MIMQSGTDDSPQNPVSLPSAHQIRQAVRLYLDNSYQDQLPDFVQRFVPPDACDPAEWLMTDVTERDPDDAPLADVRSFAMRIGNVMYPHMKLRLSRPPRHNVFLLSVDCHDAFLKASPDSGDTEALEALKSHNAAVAKAIHEAWDAAGLPTERSYLR